MQFVEEGVEAKFQFSFSPKDNYEIFHLFSKEILWRLLHFGN